MKRISILMSAVLTTTPAVADRHNTPVAMSIDCNANGAVLNLDDGAVYYLGKSCDAARKGGGTGNWWYAAAAFLVEIDRQTRRFPNELNCEIPYCTYPDR